MPIWDEFSGFFKTMRVYLLGRGLLSLAVLATTMGAAALGFSPFIPALVVAIGGGILNAGMRVHSQALYENSMIDLYREDIAIHLGIAPEQVTRAHLKEAARENEVIAQALTRQRRINIVSFSTSALAATVTLGLLYFGLSESVGQTITEFFGKYFKGAADFARYASVGIVSGTSSLILHNGLEEAIGHGTGLSKAVAHDLIAAMDRDIKRGRSISPEQVYGVLVAEDPTLKQSIATRFGERFDKMLPLEQRATMDALGVTADMTEIANIITQGKVPPGRLAYMIHYSHPTKKAQAAAQEPVPTRSNHVERLGLTPRDEARSHVERLAQQQTPALQLASAAR